METAPSNISANRNRLIFTVMAVRRMSAVHDGA
jgi:hypothetical protein